MNKILPFIKFGIVGIINTIICLGIYYLLLFFNVDYNISMICGYIISSIVGYLINKTWVFYNDDRKNKKSVYKYYALYLFSLLLNLLCMYVFVKILNISEYIAPLITLMITTVVNFFVNKYWVFSNKEDFKNKILLLKNNKRNVIVFVIFAFLVVSLFLGNAFIHPSADDYSNSSAVLASLPENYNIIDYINVVNGEAIHTYKTWQGTYFSNLLFPLNPLVFKNVYIYRIVMLIIQIFCVFSIFLFFSALPKLDIGINKKDSRLLFYIFTLFALCFSYSLGEGFYWFTGIVLYMLPFSLSLIFIRELLLFYKTNKIIHYFMTLFLIIILSGTSYITGLFLGFILLMNCIKYFIDKRSKKDKILGIFLLIIFIICFCFNVFCPGNFNRISNYQREPVVVSIIMSCVLSFRMLIDLIFNTLYVPIILCLIPIIKKIVQKSKIKFKYPYIIFILCMLSFVSLFLPMSYAYGSLYEEVRVKNVQILYLIILLTFSIIYIIGYYYKNNKEFKQNFDSYNCNLNYIICFLALLAININNTSGYTLLKELYTGEMIKYNKCVTDLNNNLKNTTGTIVIENCKYPYSVHANYLINDNWATDATGAFYDVKIIVKEENK